MKDRRSQLRRAYRSRSGEVAKKILRRITGERLYEEAKLRAYRVTGRPPRQGETSKARARREREGFFDHYCRGHGLDIGYGGDPVTPECHGWDGEHGDAQYIESIPDAAYDFVYSSHTLEHMVDPDIAITNWWRAVRPGGYLLLSVPHRDLYEKKERLPSRWNSDHKHFFLPDRDDSPNTIGLRSLIMRCLPGSEIIYIKECSEGHTITDPMTHSDGEYSIEAVVRKPDMETG